MTCDNPNAVSKVICTIQDKTTHRPSIWTQHLKECPTVTLFQTNSGIFPKATEWMNMGTKDIPIFGLKVRQQAPIPTPMSKAPMPPRSRPYSQ